MIKIIFQITVIFLVLWVAIDTISRLRKPRDQSSESNYEDDISYELVDDIVALRERSKQIENLISDLEAGIDETESGITMRFQDASGDYHFPVSANEQLLKYLYSERAKIRKDIARKMRTF